MTLLCCSQDFDVQICHFLHLPLNIVSVEGCHCFILREPAALLGMISHVPFVC